MKRVVALLLTLSMIISASGCRPIGNNGGSTVTVEPTAVPEDTCKRVSTSIVRKHNGILNKAGNEVVSIDYDTATIFVDNEPVDSISKYLQEQSNILLKGFYEVDPESIPQADQDGKYATEVSLTPKRIDESVISFVITQYSNTMGPHPNITKMTVNFDAQNYHQLKLEDLSEDYSALRRFLCEYVLKLMTEHKGHEGFFEGYEGGISSIVADGTWYFSDDGITFICNTDIVGPHALGIMEFTVPYEELSSYINEKWLPTNVHGGAVDSSSVSIASEYDTSSYDVDSIKLDSDGRTFAIITEKTVYDLTLSSVIYNSDNDEFTVTRVIYKTSSLSDKDALEITAIIPEGAPNLQLSYKLSDGTTIICYISESGKDGSLLLSEL